VCLFVRVLSEQYGKHCVSAKSDEEFTVAAAFLGKVARLIGEPVLNFMLSN